MLIRVGAIVTTVLGLFSGQCEAGCFGPRNFSCQTPVVCTPCACAPVVVQTQFIVQPQVIAQPQMVCNPCGPVVQDTGPAFVGRSSSTPLGVDQFGNRVMSVESIASAIARSETFQVQASEDKYDMQAFLQDLLMDDLKPNARNLTKAQVLGTILETTPATSNDQVKDNRDALKDVLAPYKIN